MLANGTSVDIVGGGSAVVGRGLGEGGQAFVFEVRDQAGSVFALKWYKKPEAAQYTALGTLIESGPPSGRFLWPLALATVRGRDGFGYLMPMRPPEYVEMLWLMAGRDKDGAPVAMDTGPLTAACYHVARELLRLHARGLCYRDINFGNVFLVPATGHTLICDNDNVGIDGTSGTVAGTPKFMAPEVVRRQYMAGRGAEPSARTDRHSLAVLLFYLLFVANPLEGRRTDTGLEDEAWQLRHFGTDPLFCLDPNDDRNRPVVEGPLQYWSHYPRFLRDLFCQAFGPGLGDPDARVAEGIWTTSMLRLRDSMFACAGCGGLIFVDWDDEKRACVRCGAAGSAPPSVRIGAKRVVVGPHTQVWSDHFGGDPDTTRPIGQMTQRPADPTCWGVRNLTERPWSATTPDGRVHDVPPGRAVTAIAGTRIQFGSGQGTVLA